MVGTSRIREQESLCNLYGYRMVGAAKGDFLGMVTVHVSYSTVMVMVDTAKVV